MELTNIIYPAGVPSTADEPIEVFSWYKEEDQLFTTTETSWDLTNPVRVLNEGFTIIGNEIEFQKEGRYVIHANGGHSNNSGFSGMIWSRLDKVVPGALITFPLAASTFRVIEINTIGDKSGGGTAMVAVDDFAAGDRIKIASRGQVNSILMNANITIYRLSKSTDTITTPSNNILGISTAAVTLACDQYVHLDASAGAITQALPAPSAECKVGIKAINLGAGITITGTNIYYNSSTPVSSITMNTQGQSMLFVSDGVNWYVH